MYYKYWSFLAEFSACLDDTREVNHQHRRCKRTFFLWNNYHFFFYNLSSIMLLGSMHVNLCENKPICLQLESFYSILTLKCYKYLHWYLICPYSALYHLSLFSDILKVLKFICKMKIYLHFFRIIKEQKTVNHNVWSQISSHW